MPPIIFTSAKNSVLATEYFRAKFFLSTSSQGAWEERKGGNPRTQCFLHLNVVMISNVQLQDSFLSIEDMRVKYIHILILKKIINFMQKILSCWSSSLLVVQ